MMMDQLECPICTEIAKNAVETQCCHNIMCEKCQLEIQNKKSVCPLCRSQIFSASPSIIIRKMIGNIKSKCSLCNFETTQSELETHMIVCPNRNYKCGIGKNLKGGCNFTGMKKQFLEHGLTIHEKIIVQALENTQMSQLLDQSKNCDPTQAKLNSLSKQTRISFNGKYYCGGQLGEKCSCCNGFCGPTNGCNCSACMELDLTMRNLPLKGYAVNRLNRLAIQKGKLFYCGCFLDQKSSCREGSQCTECSKLQNKRYQKFLM